MFEMFIILLSCFTVLITKIKGPEYYNNLQPLQCYRANLYAPHLDVAKAKVAFGRWALPQLVSNQYYKEYLRSNLIR